jgi:hypothetical protein
VPDLARVSAAHVHPLLCNLGMSDEQDESTKSRVIRLTVFVLLGVLAGAVLCPPVGNAFDPWFRAGPLIYTVAGALCGLSVELVRRFIQAPSNSRAKREKR